MNGVNIGECIELNKNDLQCVAAQGNQAQTMMQEEENLWPGSGWSDRLSALNPFRVCRDLQLLRLTVNTRPSRISLPHSTPRSSVLRHVALQNWGCQWPPCDPLGCACQCPLHLQGLQGHACQDRPIRGSHCDSLQQLLGSQTRPCGGDDPSPA